MIIFAGNASTQLAQAICQYLDVPLGASESSFFSNGESWVKVDENVRGKDCFIIQSTYRPVNDHLMELLLFVDALRRASARTINAVLPYFAYSRQDRKDEGRVPLSAKLVANMLTTAGVDRVLTMDLHSGQIQGFFDIPVDNLYAVPVLAGHVQRLSIPDLVVASPDVGNVKRARAYARALDAQLVIIDKRRPRANECEVMNLIGDVEGSNAFLFDDIIDTGGSICNAVTALKAHGAKDVYAACTHAVLSGPARERLIQSELKKLYVTDTIPVSSEKQIGKIEVVSVAPLFGETIRRIHDNKSVSALFV